MDFNMKKLASDAGIFFTRAVQFTEEKFGQAEKTELDAHFENLLARADSTKNWTEKILRQTEVLLQPNPSARVEEFLYEKLDRKVPSRVTGGELLAQYMAEAASELGPTTPYGETLIKVAEAEKRLGAAERDFIHAASASFLTPLRNFLEGDWKTISKERRLLQNRRLDLDACKARLKKAKAAEAKATTVPDFQETRPRNYILSASASALWNDEVDKAEQELRVAQTEFDRQAEVTRLLLEGISSTHVNHLRCLHEFVESQTTYYAQCYRHMLDLQKQLGRCPPGAPGSQGPMSSPTSPGHEDTWDFQAPLWEPRSPPPHPSAARRPPPPRPQCLWDPLWLAWPLQRRRLSAWKRWPHLPAEPGRPGFSTTTRQPIAVSWPCWLMSSSLSTACLAWTPTGSLAREATRRARSLSPTWSCSAKQTPPQALAHSVPGMRRWAQCCHLSVGDPAAQGGETPHCPCPSHPAVPGPHRLNGPSPSPSPALPLTWFRASNPATCAPSTLALPAPAKAQVGVRADGPREPCGPHLSRERLPSSCQKQPRGRQQVCSRPRRLAAVASVRPGAEGSLARGTLGPRAASPRCYPPPQAKYSGRCLPLSTRTF
ncbi:endophilin-B2 isoform X2 [Manis pentadactyla]|uniref:endophilin-B2 isoform X2 n=1 Tax=Manis pentadactyla TaxID=143292 RepID=UPI00255CF42A|nr:endophilin-B2 isoform X2 [Manis pentadactyla]